MNFNHDLILDLMGNTLLFMLIYGMSATVNAKHVLKQLNNRKAILTAISLQFILLPFLGFLCVKCLKMSNTTGIMLLVVTSSPGGSYSNWWCSIFNADLALSVTMTAISTLLSVVMLPLNLILYSKFTFEAHVVESLDFISLFIALLVVILAISLGLASSAYIKTYKFNIFANKLGNISGIVLVLFSMYMSNSSEESRMWGRPWHFYVGVMLPCVVALIIGNVITTTLKLAKPERVTISIETCYQNVGIATSVAMTMFDGAESSEAIGVPAYYGLLEGVLLGIYCIGAWKLGWTKAPPTDPFCKVIEQSYEVITEKKQLEEIEICIADEDGESISPNEDRIHYYVSFDDKKTSKSLFSCLAACGGDLSTVSDAPTVAESDMESVSTASLCPIKSPLQSPEKNDSV